MVDQGSRTESSIATAADGGEECYAAVASAATTWFLPSAFAR
jgi:hypothetical protein